ncbi:MAG: hypothetical protein JHD33_11505 [Chthoniobacterales bacterium]|nr:hypothetical protein [Chthoniobacterales bacterium]
MSSAIEYTMQVKPGAYEAVMAAYVDFANRFGQRNPSEDLILVTGDPVTGVIRGIGVFLSNEEAADVVNAGMFVDFRDSVADLLTTVPVRVDLDLVHVFVKPPEQMASSA